MGAFVLPCAAMGALQIARKGAIWAGLCGVLVVSPARAATEEEKAGARAAATQGAGAFDQKRWADALDLFSRAESLVHSPVHLLFKARALVELGQLVKARETYVQIVREQQPTPPSALLTTSQEAAKQELAAVEPRLANVTISVAGEGAATATVTMDGAKVPAALVGLSRPVDPGEHTLQALGNGVGSDLTPFSVKEGGSATVTLQLKTVPGALPPAVAPMEPASPGAAASGAAPAALAAPPTVVDAGSAPKGGGGGLRVGSYIAFGVGAVGLAAGTVFAITAKGKYDDGNALCKSFPCNLTAAQSKQRTQFGKDGDSAKTLSMIGFIAGGVGVAAGTTLLLLSSHNGSQEKVQLEPWIGVGSLGMNGAF